MNARRAAVFLDRDGVLNVDTGYVYRPADLALPAFAGEGLRALAAAGYLLIVVSNQSGVARGYFGLSEVEAFHQALQRRYADEFGVRFAAIEVCPHHPDGSVAPFNIDCECRKPKTGLLRNAAHRLAIDWQASALIGDRDSDIDCGLAQGLLSIQIDGPKHSPHPGASFHAKHLLEAANFILTRGARHP